MKNLRKRMIVFALASIVIGAVGCQETSAESEQPGDSEDDEALEGLPAIGGDSEAVDVEPPSLCTWVQSADAIVVGELLEATMADTPMVSQEGDPWVTSCDGSTNDGVRMTLSVDEVLGEQEQEVVDGSGQVVVHGGFGYADVLHGFPEEGQQVGMALHRVPDYGLPAEMQGETVWSLMGELLFEELEVTGTGIAFQQVYGAMQPPPVGVEGLSVHELDKQIDDCESNDNAEERRARMWRVWGPRIEEEFEESGLGNPVNYLAALCIPDEVDDPECIADSDCGVDSDCVDGECE